MEEHSQYSEKAGQPSNQSYTSCSGKRFFSSQHIKNSCESHPSYSPMVIRAFFPQECRSNNLKLTTHFCLVLKLRKHRAILPFTHISSWYDI